MYNNNLSHAVKYDLQKAMFYVGCLAAYWELLWWIDTAAIKQLKYN